MTKPKTKPAPAPALNAAPRSAVPGTPLLDPAIPDTDTPPAEGETRPLTSPVSTAPVPLDGQGQEEDEIEEEIVPEGEQYASEVLELTIRIPADRSVLNRPGYIGRRHDIKLTEQQAKALRCVTFSLDQLEESTRDGKPIRMRDRNALCWILDQITAAVFASPQKS